MKRVSTVGSEGETLVRSLHKPGIGLDGPKKSRPGIGVPERDSPCQRVLPDSRYFCYHDGKGQELVCGSYHVARAQAAVLFQCEPDAVTVVGPFQPVNQP